MTGFALIAGCGNDGTGPATPFEMELGEVLGGEAAEGFRRADQPRTFSFPADHGGHPGYRNEWWYLTGNLESDGGRRFGYQVTFFRTALRPPGDNPPDPASAWATDHIWMAHAAVTDAGSGTHVGIERFARAEPDLAGAETEPLRIWLENWQLAGDGNRFPRHLTVDDTRFSLTLDLEAEKPPVLQGENGLSRKSAEPGNASYYYSLTRIATRGELTLDGETWTVAGSSWLDREWSTSALAPGQTGWDWFSLQFDNGRELMYYRLRDERGNAHPNSQGNFTDAAAGQTLIRAGELELEERRGWEAPNGVIYTTAWTLRYRDRAWRVEAVLEDQFMNVSVPYWEGAVDVLDLESGESVGRGYLEMVRE